jgi:hypothetical protein
MSFRSRNPPRRIHIIMQSGEWSISKSIGLNEIP